MAEPKWLKDWQEFRGESSRSEVPLPEPLRRRLQYDLNPTTWQVFNRLFVVHLLWALIIVAVCPHPETETSSFLLGAVFMLGTVLTVGLSFSPEKQRIVFKKSWWLLPALVFASFGALYFLRDETFSILHILWIGGALLTTFGLRRIFAMRL